MKKRIDVVLFILVGSAISMLAFIVGLNVIKFLMDNPIVLVILFVLTIVIEVRDYIKSI